MILTKNKSFKACSIQQPSNAKFLLILTLSIFFPIYITIPVVITVCIFIVKENRMLTPILNTPNINLYALLSLLLLTVPILYRNYMGFFCGLLVITYSFLEFFISNAMTKELFDSICNVCCGMSFVCAVIAVTEKISGLHNRVEALTGNANYYAYIIELMALICYYKFITATAKKPLYLLVFAANIAALVLTECRSAWIALLIGLLLFSLILKNRKSFIILSVISVGLAAAVFLNPSLLPRYSDLDFSFTDRFTIWKNALADFLAHPIFGRGLFAYAQISGSKVIPHAHNIFIECLESTGIVGTAIISVFFGSVIKDLAESWKSGDQKMKASVALCGGLIAATFVHGMTDAPIMGAQTGLLFILVLSLRPRAGKVPAMVPAMVPTMVPSTVPSTVSAIVSAMAPAPAQETVKEQYRMLELVSKPVKSNMSGIMEFRETVQYPMTKQAFEKSLKKQTQRAAAPRGNIR